MRFTFAHVQMFLYRPFLHYISPRLSAGKAIDERYYACAAAGISVSRNIVHIGAEIKKQEVLAGPYWFILYTVFFGILSLVFYALENPDKPGSAEMLAEAAAAKDMINSLTRRSLTADRVAETLNVSYFSVLVYLEWKLTCLFFRPCSTSFQTKERSRNLVRFPRRNGRRRDRRLGL